MADAVGLMVLFALLCVTASVAPLGQSWWLVVTFSFVALAALNLWLWHRSKHGLASPKQWLGYIAMSLALGSVSLAVDLAVGHFTNPDLPLMEAFTRTGPFGVGATGFVIVAGAFCGVPGLVRALLLARLRHRA